MRCNSCTTILSELSCASYTHLTKCCSLQDKLVPVRQEKQGQHSGHHAPHQELNVSALSALLQTCLTLIRKIESKDPRPCGLTGTFARFQPATADFQKDVGADMEAVLEAALHARSSLSQGDWVVARHAGQSYALRVQHLQPEAAVSVIGGSGSPSMPASRQLLACSQGINALALQYCALSSEPCVSVPSGYLM